MLLVGSYATTWAITSGTSREGVESLTRLHRSFGVAVLGLTIMRFAIRQFSRVPELPRDTPPLQRLAACLTAVALYALLCLQPLLGLTASMLHGDRITLVGGFVVPGLLRIDRSMSHTLFQAHGAVATLLLCLLGLHIAAALYHHFILRDEVLTGMLGSGRRTAQLRPAPQTPARS